MVMIVVSIEAVGQNEDPNFKWALAEVLPHLAAFPDRNCGEE